LSSNIEQDIQHATSIAYAMVTQYGFSDVLGNFDYHSSHGELSAETKKTIESEVRKILEDSRERAKALLTERRKELELVAKALVEYETLDLEEVNKVLKGEKLPKITAAPSTPIKLPELALPPSMGGGGPAGASTSETQPEDGGSKESGDKV
jgi:ATP-dependent metalloprotease